MGENKYFKEERDLFKCNYLIQNKNKDKHRPYFDDIPEQYKRRDYIIDKLNCKKKNVE